MNSQIIPLLGIISPSFTPEPLRTITVNATFEGEQTSVYKEAVLMDSASSRDVLSYFPLRDGKYSSHSFVASAIDNPDKNRVIMLYGSSPEDQAVVSKSLKITSDLNILLDLSETGGGIVDYPLLTGIGKLSGYFDLSSLPESVNYSDITIIANYRDPLEGTYNGLQAGKTTCNPDGSWAIEGLNEAHRYNVVMSIPTFNDITYSNKETSDSTYVPVGDPHWDKVVALLHFDGVNGSTTFDDDAGRSWTAAGTAQIDTAQAGAFGGSSGLFDGAGARITTPGSADFAFGTGDFTIEMRVRQVGPVSQWRELFMVNTGYGLNIMLFDGKLTIGRENVANDYTVPAPVALGDWHHLAISRAAGVVYVFVNGTLALSVAYGHDFSQLATVSIGAKSGGTNAFAGHIDELRVTKGVARYTENFTPPTEPFPNHLPR